MTRRSQRSLLLAGVSAVAGLALLTHQGVAEQLSSAPDIRLGEPEFGGTGCPEGTVRAVLSSDKRRLRLLFQAYAAETEASKRFARKSCSVAIPVQIPPGLSISVQEVDYLGYASIPSGGRGRFRAEYFFAGSRGPTVTRNFLPGFRDDFEDQVDMPTWSPCGEDTIARANSSIIAQKSSATSNQEAYVAIGTMRFMLQWRDCND